MINSLDFNRLENKGATRFGQAQNVWLGTRFVLLFLFAGPFPCCLSVGQLVGQTARQRELFETHVRPVLTRHCIQCHGESKQESGLKLLSREDLLQGGESGPAIVAGKPAESLLIEALRYESLEMPPDGKLQGILIRGISEWIAAGAPWPRGIVLKKLPLMTEQDRDWWCYQPLSHPPVPKVDDSGWCRNDIDRFVLRKLQQEGLQPAPAASPLHQARRLHFGVTGLPPQPDALEEISGETGWYEGWVDRLLGSTAYGENQARFWLDLVRYADSDGYNADHARPEAFHYRDYVIRSFNADKRYDRFVMEQLAGDEIDPGNRDAVIATMYLRHWIYEWNQRDVEGQWQQILSDVTETTADVFLAQGLKCARCHDHKFDPLLQKDYFALKAFFTPLQPREDQPVATVEERQQYRKQQEKWEQATREIRRQLHEIERPVLLKHATREGFDKFTAEIRSMIASRAEQRTPYQQQIASLASNQFDLHPEKLPEWLDADTEKRRQELRKKLAQFDKLQPKPLPTIRFVATDVGSLAPPTTVPDSAEPRDIPPGFPTILKTGKVVIEPPPAVLNTTGRRTALAKWIADPENPFTARVIVNRIWQQHFGRGLVATTSDFGRLGASPSHPELLDWLARKFVEDGWSLKKLHRLILTSATYRQTSDTRKLQERVRQDPQNVLLGRMTARRLAAEEIHDCLLVASGELGKQKRAIYKPVKRNRLDPLLASFDFPDRVESQGQRHQTTTSPQALLLMNDPWLHERARFMMRSLSGNADEQPGQVADDAPWIRAAYRRLYFRLPDADEMTLARKFLEAYEELAPVVEPPRRVGEFPDGKPALLLKPENRTTVRLPKLDELRDPSASGDLTVEATVLLHSLYPDATVRTVVASWSGQNSQRGWSLGVTSSKSAFQPRNLILQLIGSRSGPSGKPEYEVVASNLRVELNKPYYLAVSVDLDSNSQEGITFYLKDLSRADSPLQTASVAHKARFGIQSDLPIEIGGRLGKHQWDGLVQNVRYYQRALRKDELPVAAGKKTSNSRSAGPLFDLTFEQSDQLGRDRSPHGHHVTVRFGGPQKLTRREQARAALIHALLCANEAIYVD